MEDPITEPLALAGVFMRGAVLLAASLGAALGAGCATTRVDVAFEATHDFSQHRTWDWLPRGQNVYALPEEERALEALLSRLVAEELGGRGLVKVPSGADLRVGYELRVQRVVVVTNETGAEDLLPSQHASPSYLVQTTRSHIDVYDTGSLWVVVTDGRREQRLWRGELRVRRRGHLTPHLPELISRLFLGFPAGNPADVP